MTTDELTTTPAVDVERLPYCVTITKPDMPTVHLGFRHSFQAEQVAGRLIFDRRHSNCPEGAVITAGPTPDGVDPLPPVPTAPYALVEAMDAEDTEQSHELRYPNLYTRLRALEGQEEASRAWKAACSLADAEAAYAEQEQREAEEKRSQQRAGLVAEVLKLRLAVSDEVMDDRGRIAEQVQKVLCQCPQRGLDADGRPLPADCGCEADAFRALDAVLDGLLAVYNSEVLG
jgi:hypothetical protein